jgi:hypothetical protein
MIIFFNKTSGKIIGMIEGRIHQSEHLKEWVGDREKNDRLVIEWVKNKEGFFEPNVNNKEQKKLLIEIDKNPIDIYNYIIDINTKELRVKEKK